MTENTSIHLSGSSYKRMENIIHIVAWVIVFGIPFFFTGREQQEMTTTEYIHREIAPISFMSGEHFSISGCVPIAPLRSVSV